MIWLVVTLWYAIGFWHVRTDGSYGFFLLQFAMIHKWLVLPMLILAWTLGPIIALWKLWRKIQRTAK